MKGLHAVPHPQPVDKAMLTLDEATEVLQEAGWKIGRTAVYEATRRGELDAVKLGRNLRIPRSSLARYLGEQGAA
jgi:excisionase family DNA binding protein